MASIKTHQPEFIGSITVVYGDEPSQAPSDRIREINGRNEDINAGFGGAFVWLVPGYTVSGTNAITSFDVVIQDSADPTKKDLAKGAGGQFRYLVPVADRHSDKKVFNVGLLRLESALDGVPQGYDGKTIDLNKGRGGDFLYLVWKSDRD